MIIARELVSVFILGIALATFAPWLGQTILMLGLIYIVKPDVYNLENLILLKIKSKKILDHLKSEYGSQDLNDTKDTQETKDNKDNKESKTTRGRPKK